MLFDLGYLLVIVEPNLMPANLDTDRIGQPPLLLQDDDPILVSTNQLGNLTESVVVLKRVGLPFAQIIMATDDIYHLVFSFLAQSGQ